MSIWLLSLQVVMLVLILIFATVHSGMASLRNTAENIIGERAYRVLFAGISLPLALSTIVSFFFNCGILPHLYKCQNQL